MFHRQIAEMANVEKLIPMVRKNWSVEALITVLSDPEERIYRIRQDSRSVLNRRASVTYTVVDYKMHAGNILKNII